MAMVILKLEIPEGCQVRCGNGVVKSRRFRFRAPHLLALECAIRPGKGRPDEADPRALQEFFQREAEPIISARVSGLAALLKSGNRYLLTAWLDMRRRKPESILPLLDTDVPLGVIAEEFNGWAGKRSFPLSSDPFHFPLSDPFHYRLRSPSHPFESCRNPQDLHF